MLDVVDFIQDRGGNPNVIRESQRKRHAPVEVVDEVIALYEDHRKSAPFSSPSFYREHKSLADPHLAKYEAQQVGSKINATQKEIGQRFKVRPWARLTAVGFL